MGIVQAIVEQLGPWTWWVVGLALAAVEVVVPGSFFIFFAIAAILTGTLALVVDFGWQVELVVFAALAVASVLVGRKIYGKTPSGQTDNGLNDRVSRQIGRVAVLDTALSSGSGHVRLDDSLWRVEGPDLPAGTRVRITGVRDGRLQVEPA